MTYDEQDAELNLIRKIAELQRALIDFEQIGVFGPAGGGNQYLDEAYRISFNATRELAKTRALEDIELIRKDLRDLCARYLGYGSEAYIKHTLQTALRIH